MIVGRSKTFYSQPVRGTRPMCRTYCTDYTSLTLEFGVTDVQCTLSGGRYGKPGDPVKRRVDWMLQNGVFPPWEAPSDSSRPPETMTTLSAPPSLVTPQATNGDSAQSPIKPQHGTGLSLGEVTYQANVLLPV